MSKAFVREDDASEEVSVIRRASTLLPGTRNRLTATGAIRLQSELAELQAQRSPLAGADRTPDSRRELQELDVRIRQLAESLRTAEIGEVPPPPWETVYFGATVTVRSPAQGETSTYRLVGTDEADPSSESISWQSPLARALINAKLGSRVTVELPSGSSELEILRIHYE